MQSSSNRPPLPLLLLFLLLCAPAAARAQYQGYGYGMAQGPAYGYGPEEGQMMDGGEVMDERPRVQLGIRLKIPAFKFELPRVSLPKVTISAKIRQPDRPRTINLPEINLDTSSRVVPPGAMGAQAVFGRTQVRSLGARESGGYGAPNMPYDMPHSYGSSYGTDTEAQRTQSFTFSTDEERTMPNNAYQINRPMQSAYSSTNIHPSYLIAQQNNAVRSPSAALIAQNASKDPDSGFDRSTYNPELHNSSPAYPTKKQIAKKSTEKKSTGSGKSYKMNVGRYGLF